MTPAYKYSFISTHRLPHTECDSNTGVFVSVSVCVHIYLCVWLPTELHHPMTVLRDQTVEGQPSSIKASDSSYLCLVGSGIFCISLWSAAWKHCVSALIWFVLEIFARQNTDNPANEPYNLHFNCAVINLSMHHLIVSSAQWAGCTQGGRTCFTSIISFTHNMFSLLHAPGSITLPMQAPGLKYPALYQDDV